MDPGSSAPPPTNVFISYSRVDQAFVRELSAALEREGREAWVDWEGIPPSAEWLAEVYAAIEASDAFVFVLSPDSVSSAVCGLELSHAAAHNKRLIPVVARECSPETTPDTLRRLNWVLMRPSDEFAAALAKLLEALDTDLPWVKSHTRIVVRAAEWGGKGRDSSLLLRGKDLKQAEQWLSDAARHDSPQPSALQIEFIVASRRADTRRQRIVLASTATALAVSIGLAIWAFRERNVAQRQTQLSVANNLLVESQSDRHDARLRILFAVESLRRLVTQGRASTETLQTVDTIASLRARKLGSAQVQGVTGLAVSPRGDRLATWSGSVITVRYTLGMTGARELQADGVIHAAAFDVLATRVVAGVDGGVLAFDLSSNGAAVTRFPCGGRASVVQFDRSGRYLAARTVDAAAQRLCLWSVDPQKMLASVEVQVGGDALPPEAMAFSADSRFLGAVMPRPGGGWRVALFDTQSGVERHAWTLDGNRPRIAFRGSTLTVAEERAVWGWKADEDREVSRWALDPKWRPLALSGDGRFVLVQMFSGVSFAMDDFSYVQVGLFDAAGGIELAQMAHVPTDFTPDGEYLVDSNALLQIPAMRTVRVVPSSPHERLMVIDGGSSVAVTLSADGALTAWKLADAPELAATPLHPTAAMPRAFSADSATAAIASGRDVRLISLADPSTSGHVRSTHQVEALSFAGDGRTLVGVGDGTLTMWDLPTLAMRVELSTGPSVTPSEVCGLLDAVCRRRAEQPWLALLKPLFVGRNARFVVWDAGAAQIWTVPDGKRVYTDSVPSARRAFLEIGTSLLIGHDDGRVTMVDVERWQPQWDRRVHAGHIDALAAVGGSDLMAAVTREEKVSFQGQPEYPSSKWSLTLFSRETGETRGSRAGAGTLGPWNRDGSRVVVQSDDEQIDIMRASDGSRVRAAVALSKSVAQRARPQAFTSDGRFLLVTSETPITGGRAEPTIHIVDAETGREITRWPERDLNKPSVRLDRSAEYPEHFLVDGAHDLVAAVVYRNADAFWAVSAARADKQLTVLRVSADGRLEPLLRTAVPGDVAPIGFAAGGRFLATAPIHPPEPSEMGAYALRLWSVGLDDRLQLACAAADGDLTPQEWSTFIGSFTGESWRPTCASQR